MEKEEQPIQPESDDKFEYYINRGNKIRDFWNGIFIGFGYVVLSLILILSLDMITTWWFYIMLLVIYIGGTLYFFIIKRKFLAIGLIFIVTVPPAVIGGCLYLTS